MTNLLHTKIRRRVALGLCAVLAFAACSTPTLPFGATDTPRPIAVTLFFTPAPAESPTPEPEPAMATSAPTVLAQPTPLPTTAPTLSPTEVPTVPVDLPIISIAPTETSPPPTAVATIAPRIITVVVTVTVIATSPPIVATPKLTITATPTLASRTTRTATPTPDAKNALTPTRAPTRPKPTAVPAATLAPASVSNVLAVTYKSGMHSDPWGMPFNEDGCTQFDDRRQGRKVYLDIIVHALDSSLNSWNAQFYQNGTPFLTCISDPFIQHGTLRERDIPARGYPLPFDISKTLIAFVPEGQSVTQLNVIANGKVELCFALSGASVSAVRCG